MRDEIAAAGSNARLIVFLKDKGEAATADKIDRFARTGEGLNDIPDEGGLREKVFELYLSKKLDLLRRRYLPGMNEASTLTLFQGLTDSIESVVAFSELISPESPNCLCWSLIPGAFDLMDEARHFQTGPAPKSFERDLRTEFGFGKKVKEFSLKQVKSDEQDALKKMGVTGPEWLIERPWKATSLKPYPELLEAFQEIKRRIEERLGVEKLDHPTHEALILSVEETIKGIPMAHEPIVIHPRSKGDWGQNLTDELKKRGLNFRIAGGFLFGGEIAPRKPYEGRFYLSIERNRAADLWELLERNLFAEAKKTDVPLMYQIAKTEDAYETTNSGAIRFDPKDEAKVLSLITDFYHAASGFLRPTRPFLSLPIANRAGQEMKGIFFAPDPFMDGIQFSSRQTVAFKRGFRLGQILLKHLQQKGEKLHWEEFFQILTFSLDQEGVDLANPALSRQGLANYPKIGARIRLAPR
jgi:hypothetical protein